MNTAPITSEQAARQVAALINASRYEIDHVTDAEILSLALMFERFAEKMLTPEQQAHKLRTEAQALIAKAVEIEAAAEISQ